MLKEAREAGRESAAAEQKTKDELKLSRVLNPMVKRFGYMQRNAAEIPKRAQAEAERAKAKAERAPAHVSSSAATPFRGGMNLFGRRPNSAAPAPTPAQLMGASERMLQNVEMLTKREEHLQRKIDNEIRMAREFSAQKKKQEALTCIKRKTMYEKQMERIIGAFLCT